MEQTQSSCATVSLCSHIAYTLYAVALQLELVPSSIMVAEDSEEGSEVTVIVSSTGQTVRPVNVSLVTFDLTATGNSGN